MGKAPAVPSKKKARAPARSKLAKQIGIVLGSGTLLAAAVATYIVFTSGDTLPSLATASTQASAAPPVPVDHSGSIVIKSATGCRRMKFDNATGAITDDGATPCPEGGLSTGGSATDRKAQAERFGQIANGFKH